MTTTHTTRRFGAAGCLAATLSLVALAGCSSEDARTTPGTPTQSLEVTTSAAPAFEEKDVPVKKAEVLTEPVKDEGLNVTWELQGTVGGNAGGSVLTLLVTNNNEAPLPQKPSVTLSSSFPTAPSSSALTQKQPELQAKTALTFRWAPERRPTCATPSTWPPATCGTPA